MFYNGLRVTNIKISAFSESYLNIAEQNFETAVLYALFFHIYVLY